MPQTSSPLQKPSFKAVFFDLGDTLAKPMFSAAGELTGLEVFPGVPELLARLQSRGIDLGIISNTGNEAPAKIDDLLASAALLNYFRKPLRVYSSDPEIGVTKSDPLIFKKAAARAGVAAMECIFVGESPDERAVAAQAHYGAVLAVPSLVEAELGAGATPPASKPESPNQTKPNRQP